MDRPRVLVVDDEPVNRALIRAALQGFCDISEAGSGAEALAALAASPADLVLLDVMMPGMDGYEVCRRIKEQAPGFLPVVLVSALGDQSDKNRGLEAGADDFLTKPVDRRELLLRSRAFLRLREQDRVIRRQLEDMSRLQAAKDELVALLVHDLRNPLSGVVAVLQLLREELTGRNAADVDEALESAGTALSRLDEALQVRLLEEGRLPIRREAVSLSALVAETLRPMEGVARRKNVMLERSLDGDALIPVDRRLAQRALENLVANAIRYTPAGKEVLVSARLEQGAVVFEVADRGPGIPDSLKGALFEKFGSVEAHRGGARAGIGLGLYLVKLVADGHGGAVGAEDRPGGGAIFRLSLGTS